MVHGRVKSRNQGHCRYDLMRSKEPLVSMQEPLLKAFVQIHILLPILLACICPNTPVTCSDQELEAVSGDDATGAGTQSSDVSYERSRAHTSSTTSARQTSLKHIQKAVNLVSEISALHEKAAVAVRAAQESAFDANTLLSDLPDMVAACMEEQQAQAADTDVIAAALDHIVVSSKRFLNESVGKRQAVRLCTEPQAATTIERAPATF